MAGGAMAPLCHNLLPPMLMRHRAGAGLAWEILYRVVLIMNITD